MPKSLLYHAGVFLSYVSKVQGTHHSIVQSEVGLIAGEVFHNEVIQKTSRGTSN